MLQLVFAYLPIVILIYLMTKKQPVAADKALPIAALLVYLIVLIINKQPVIETHAVVIKGLLVAWTPITIIAGAIFLFRTMQVTGSLSIIQNWLNSISANKVAQLMIVGWAFQFVIEGASGFGTPAAIAAPILVALGLPALKVAVFCLIMNSIPVSFGAVGTPIWFGFSLLDLTPTQLSQIAFNTAFINAIATVPILILGLRFIVSWRQIRQNISFIILSALACVVPYTLVALFSYEFPSLLGGLIGLLITIFLAKKNIGLAYTDSPQIAPVTTGSLIKASFPLWGVVTLLIITRIPDLGLKSVLQQAEPAWLIQLGNLGQLSISSSLVLSLEHILNTEYSWQHSLLYVPSIIPFVVISVITFFLYKDKHIKLVTKKTLLQMYKPTIALMAALVFVNLMMMGNDQAIVTRIGNHLAALSGDNWLLLSPFLGALGSFFSGSATISNLSFAGIQYSVAVDLGLEPVIILALQAVGAALGNMVCINNIVAVASVLALQNCEGTILKRTTIIVLCYGCIAAVTGLILSN